MLFESSKSRGWAPAAGPTFSDCGCEKAGRIQLPPPPARPGPAEDSGPVREAGRRKARRSTRRAAEVKVHRCTPRLQPLSFFVKRLQTRCLYACLFGKQRISAQGRQFNRATHVEPRDGQAGREPASVSPRRLLPKVAIGRCGARILGSPLFGGVLNAMAVRVREDYPCPYVPLMQTIVSRFPGDA